MRKAVLDERLKAVYGAIGKNIRRLRGAMTQNDLAKKAGIGRSTIEAAELGKGCSLEKLIRMADALGVSPADLFITDEQRKEISYAHVLLMDKVKETLTVK